MISGNVSPDSGERMQKKGLRIAHVAQDSQYAAEATAEAYSCKR